MFVSLFQADRIHACSARTNAKRGKLSFFIAVASVVRIKCGNLSMRQVSETTRTCLRACNLRQITDFRTSAAVDILSGANSVVNQILGPAGEITLVITNWLKTRFEQHKTRKKSMKHRGFQAPAKVHACTGMAFLNATTMHCTTFFIDACRYFPCLVVGSVLPTKLL